MVSVNGKMTIPKVKETNKFRERTSNTIRPGLANEKQ
jgi:hypothetical protein